MSEEDVLHYSVSGGGGAVVQWRNSLASDEEGGRSALLC